MSKELEAFGRLMANYYEMCQDLENNDDQYQRNNLTSERAIIEKALKALEIIRKHLRIVKPFDLETKEEEPYEIFDIDLWNEGKQKEDFEFVKEVLL